MAGFDWYQATVPEDPNTVLEALSAFRGGVNLRPARPALGYGHAVELHDPIGVVGRCLYGGSHTHPHVIFSGENAQAGAELIRAEFPEHSVSRVDAREDFGDADAFDRMLPVLLEAAKRHRVKVDTRGDHLLTQQGRTVYLGAASSAVRLRQYDKAAELRAKFARDPARLAQVPEHLTRLEAQVRPQTPMARRALARAEPIEVMGCAGWLREVWRAVSGLEVTPVQVGKPWRQADDDRAYAYLLGAYGELLRRKQQQHGSWAALGQQLGHDLSERAKALRGRKG